MFYSSVLFFLSSLCFRSPWLAGFFLQPRWYPELLGRIPNPSAGFPSPLASLDAFSAGGWLRFQSAAQLKVGHDSSGAPCPAWLGTPPAPFSIPDALAGFQPLSSSIASVGRDPQGLLSPAPGPAHTAPRRAVACSPFNFFFLQSSLFNRFAFS